MGNWQMKERYYGRVAEAGKPVKVKTRSSDDVINVLLKKISFVHFQAQKDVM